MLGHGFRSDTRSFFWGGRGDGGRRTDSATNLRSKAFDSCKLFVYIWLLGASPSDPYRGSAPGPRLGTSVPLTPYAHPDFRAWLRTPLQNGTPRVHFGEYTCILLPEDEDWKAALIRPWETHARDRARFKRRVELVEKVISWVFAPQHRDKILSRSSCPEVTPPDVTVILLG